VSIYNCAFCGGPAYKFIKTNDLCRSCETVLPLVKEKLENIEEELNRLLKNN